MDEALYDALSRAPAHRRRYDERAAALESAATSLGTLLHSGDLTTANKTYLANTIRSVDGHNRRVEERKCWAQRKRERPPSSDSDGDGGGDDAKDASGGDGAPARGARDSLLEAQLAERAVWQARKERALAGGADATEARGDESEAERKRREKRDRKRRIKKDAKKEAKRILKKKEKKRRRAEGA